MKTFQQGRADGMCGLYSLLHFLNTTPDFKDEEANSTLWYLMDAARHFGWLNPYTLTQGFEDYQLKAILDLQIENYRMSYRSMFLRDAREAAKQKSTSAFLKLICERKGAAIVSETKRNHWLLVMPVESNAKVIDSWNSNDPIIDLSTKPRSFSPVCGLVILPHNRPLLVWD